MYALNTLATRRATPDDDMTVAALWRKSWASANSWATELAPMEVWFDRVRTEFRAPPKELILSLDEQGGINGFMVIDLLRGYVDQLFIDTVYQGHGLGGALLDIACKRMPHGWTLHVGRANMGAQRFYAQYGLSRGALSLDPKSGRERLAYRWNSDSEFKSF